MSKFLDKISAFDKKGKLHKFISIQDVRSKTDHKIALYDPESKQVSDQN